MPLTGPPGRRVATRAGEAWFDNEVSAAELDAIADYFTRPDAHLGTLVDRARMPGRDGLRERYAGWLWTGDPAQCSACLRCGSTGGW